MYSFRKLAIWRRAHALVLHVHEVTERNYRGRYWSLIEDMRRTATCVPSLIADASGQSTRTDRLIFVTMALEAVEDLDYHVLLARDLGLITLSDHVRLDARMEQVSRMLVFARDRVGAQGNQTTLDSRLRGNDGGVDARRRGNDGGVYACLRGKTNTSSPRKWGSSVVKPRSRLPSG